VLGTVNQALRGVAEEAISLDRSPARDGVGADAKKRAFISKKELTKEERCAALLKLLDKKSPIQGVQSLL